jgi:hypothetical protein
MAFSISAIVLTPKNNDRFPHTASPPRAHFGRDPGAARAVLDAR